jgi:hypothetical protein
MSHVTYPYRHRPRDELGGWGAPTFPTSRCLHSDWQRQEPEMMLKDKVAVIYGAGGAIGGAVARAFASEGA